MIPSREIIIVGCGRLGGVLANKLSQEGHQLVVIDRRESAFDKLTTDFTGYKIVGDAVERHVLEAANIRDADYFFATTSEDNTNLMVAQVAKFIFNVPRVVARVFDPAREAMYGELGIDTISPTKLSSAKFFEVVK